MANATDRQHFRQRMESAHGLATQRFRVIDSNELVERPQLREIDLCRLGVAVLGLPLYLGVPIAGLGVLLLSFARSLGAA